MQVAELPRRDAERILVLPRKRGDEELVVRVRGDEALVGANVAVADAVAGHFEQRVHPAFHAGHHREGQAELPAVRQHGGLHEPRADGAAGVAEVRRERHHEVFRVNAAGPVGEEATNLGDGFLGQLRRHRVAPVAQARGGGVGPREQQRVNAQRGGKALVAPEPALPHHALLVVEGRVRHADAAHARHVHAVRRVVGDLPLGEPLAQRGQVALLHVKAEAVQRREHATTGLGDGRVLDEERVPNHVRLLAFGHGPELVVSQVELPEALRDKVVINQQVINAPQQQLAERGVVEMRVDVIDRRGEDGLFNLGGERGPAFGGDGVNHQAGKVTNCSGSGP